jgi:hypothetical protein
MAATPALRPRYCAVAAAASGYCRCIASQLYSSRRANFAMVTAQHTDAIRAMMITSGAANPAHHRDGRPPVPPANG